MTANRSSCTYDCQPVNNNAAPLVSESPELVEVLQKIVRNTAALLEMQDCVIALQDARGTTLVTYAVPQGQARNPLVDRLQEHEGVTAWVAEHREALVINDVSRDPRLKRPGETPTGSLACVPLIEKEHFIGTLTASSPITGAFCSQKVHVLTIFAEQAGLAITSVYQAELARRDAARMKANFLSMITHELRSPINTINGYLDLALTDIAGELNKQQREFVQRARGGSEHLYALIEDLLLVSRADAGQLRLNREPVSFPEIVARAVEELELIAMDSGINMRVDIAGDVPPIYADADRIQQVLRNLISNAVSFTPPRGEVTISARVINMSVSAQPGVDNQDQQLVEIQVRDTGCGIAPEHQQRIFERFYQIPLEAGRSSGQGLGLAIVKMIIELHGGQVTVMSKPGEGSTFKITLPTWLS